MGKRFMLIIALMGVISIGSFAGFSVWHSTSNTPTFSSGGYVLLDESEELQQLSFNEGEKYVTDISGDISFKSGEGIKAKVDKESFVYLNDNSIMALAGGVLFDFDDLSDNFINNYYISSELAISPNGANYIARTTSGNMEFGEHIWKLSDRKYIVRSESMKLYFSDEETYDVSDYIQIYITEDGVVHLMTKDNMWMTISENCYIETAGGVKINPVTQIVDDDTYKLSVVKLSVSPEDAIVLTEDETRRQIVPELNIETIDGKDGDDGDNGTDGKEGVTGTDGRRGEDGVLGDTGEGGNKGNMGDTGDDGNNGGKGSGGKDAVIETSTNSALPTMTIKEWNVSATGLSGTIEIKDEGFFLSNLSEYFTDNATDTTRYAGSVTITNLATGQVIPCYEVDLSTGEPSKQTYFYGFNGQQSVKFTTKGEDEKLNPDTQYRLSVKAYYKANDDTKLIYEREFLSRVFTTDSVGVTLSYNEATTNSISLNVIPTADFVTGSTVSVYLLTQEQNENFSFAGINSREYIDVVTLTDLTAGNSKEIEFVNNAEGGTDTITPNTTYVARAVVKGPSLEAITKQELEVKTLKIAPTVMLDETTNLPQIPTAVYSRVAGAYQIWRPGINDPNDSAVEYVYTAYTAEYLPNDEIVYHKQETKRLKATDPEPVSFNAMSGTNYAYGIQMIYNDNEKQVTFDLGMSEIYLSTGDPMPSLTLEKETLTFNSLVGKLNINLMGESSSMADINEKPLTVKLYIDETKSYTLNIKGHEPVNVFGENSKLLGTIDFDETTINQRTISLNLNLEKLYQNSTYTIEVSGYFNIGDGNETIYRTIGATTFRTITTPKIQASYTPTKADTGKAIARNLLLDVRDSSLTEDEATAVKNELRKGQVTVELYSGTGNGKVRIGQKNINKKEELEQLLGITDNVNDNDRSGYTLTEADFGNPTLSDKSHYTLEITSVIDETYAYEKQLKYKNVFGDISGKATEITAEPTPPSLLHNSWEGVTAKPILNKDAATFRLTVDTNLPDEAIIGYTLQSTYNNLQRLGKTITYYAFEYNSYVNALGGSNPISVGAYLKSMTLNIESVDLMPKIAIIFGENPNPSVTQPSEPVKDVPVNGHDDYYNGYTIYFAGTASTPDGTLTQGMGRGFRYIFAYTVEYVSGSAGLKTYPDDHPDYASFQKFNGGLTENGVQFAPGSAYTLNSGMQSAPRIMPSFYYYVESTQHDTLNLAQNGSGKIKVHYTWHDSEGLIKTTSDNATQVSYPNPENPRLLTSHAINDTAVNVAGSNSDWFVLGGTDGMPYNMTKGENKVIIPTLDISPYIIDYSSVLANFSMQADVTAYPLAEIPIDWAWAETFKSYNKPTLEISYEYEHLNYIDFVFTSLNTDIKEILSKTAILKLTFTREKPGVEPKVKYLRIEGEDARGVYARLAIGDLGSDFIGAVNQSDVTAEILYDTGKQGWLYAEQAAVGTNNYIALQSTWDETDGTVLGAYVSAENASVYKVNGGVLQQRSGFTSNSLMNINARDPSQSIKSSFATSALPGMSNQAPGYLIATDKGVTLDRDRSTDRSDNRYVVPKQLAVMPDLRFTSSNKLSVTNVIPTISCVRRPSGSAITLQSVNVSGLEGEGVIYAAIFNTIEEATAINTGSAVNGKVARITINEYGTMKGYCFANRATGQFDEADFKETHEVSFTGLTSDTTYYMAVYYERRVDGERELTHLIKSGLNEKAESAVYLVTTSKAPKVEIIGLEYVNNSYEDKYIHLTFQPSREDDVSFRYDFFKTEEEALSDDAVPYISHEEMDGVEGGNDDILVAPDSEYIVAGRANDVRIELDPSKAREKFVPGRTYWLKITATDTLSVTEELVGTAVKEVKIDNIGNYGALVYVSNATNESITYQVTINDPQNSFVSSKKSESSDDKDYGGLFAVRFMDEEKGRFLFTKYDKMVFSAKDPIKKTFTLNEDALELGHGTDNVIRQDREYTLKLYAVTDIDHDGAINLAVPEPGYNPDNGPVPDQEYIWDTLFTDQYTSALINGDTFTVNTYPEDDAGKFGNIVNNFADGAGKIKPEMAKVESQLLVAERTQKTTGEKGYIVNTEAIYAKRAGETQIGIVFEESFGLIKKIGNTYSQTFGIIDYTIVGRTNAGQPVDITNQLDATKDSARMIFEDQDASGYHYYQLNLPDTIADGIYTISVQMRINADSPVADVRFDIKSIV